MKAIHVNWTLPFFNKNRLRGHGFKIFRSHDSLDYFQPEYSILSTMLSALWWKKLNGDIKLYTDSIGKEYYKKMGILDIYDSVDTKILDSYNNVDPAYFWTSGKIRCLKEESQPFVFLDQDFIIRSKLPEIKESLAVSHWEIPRGYYYFDEKKFKSEISHCDLPYGYDINSLVPNTSFLLFNDMKIRDYYVDSHLKLVDNKGSYVPEWFWLFTDQGILGHVIRKSHTRIETLTDRIYLSDSDHSDKNGRNLGFSEPWYTFESPKKDLVEWEHLWYLKAVFPDDPELERNIIDRYKLEIKKIFQNG